MQNIVVIMNAELHGHCAMSKALHARVDVTRGRGEGCVTARQGWEMTLSFLCLWGPPESPLPPPHHPDLLLLLLLLLLTSSSSSSSSSSFS